MKDLPVTVCFIGHRNAPINYGFKKRIYDTVKALIVNKNAASFLFGGKGKFDELALEEVTRLKGEFPHIKRVYVRAQYPFISGDYTDYLLGLYDETFFAEKAANGGKSAYILRNEEMLDKCQIAVLFFDKSVAYKSGTKHAFNYARKKGIEIINLF